jgi:poly(hydroxyalkanoate) granule-associated protein
MATKKTIAKKSNKPAAKKALKTNFATSVRDSAQEIWLAGLGAFTRAQDEGNRVFDTLVSEGKAIQQRVRGAADSVKDKLAEKRVAEVADRIVGSWSKLGQMVEDRASDALASTGVATKKEVDSLSRRVSKLGSEVEKLVSGKKTIAQLSAKAVAKKPAVKAAVKPAAKVTAKPVAKIVTKAAAKPVVKAVAKATSKSVAKPVVKAAPVAVLNTPAVVAVVTKLDAPVAAAV